ncbi:hypothetical protein NDU88_001956 [Pleurodeles waltl]|uniref:Uncharacterized protein n=1 Tax=Pleurodeles waltl TaxID=8319 RepID=A0AAV7TJA8_PLEWA|nr:hypothetical protein NDU88_001956 [Pleurodeles waltl]
MAFVSTSSATKNKKRLYCLPIALFSLRNSLSSDHFLMPHQLVTGRSIKVSVPSASPKTDIESSSQIVKAEMYEYLCELTHAAQFLSTQVSKWKEKGPIDPELPPIRPGTQIFVRKAVRCWKDPKFEGPFEVIDSSLTAVRIAERKAWIHRSDIRVDPAPPQN